MMDSNPAILKLLTVHQHFGPIAIPIFYMYSWIYYEGLFISFQAKLNRL